MEKENGTVEDKEIAVLEKRGRKRKRKRKRNKKRKREKDEGFVNVKDPLEVFGRDVMLMILNNLDARSVALSLLVSRAWNEVASSDAIWTSKVFYFS